ncbi:MAG: hypothetical protein OXI83_03260, partial [Gemmatimonadota bacterium]|nr:hypothetical protein [Gemmatimonadota bacterium]
RPRRERGRAATPEQLATPHSISEAYTDAPAHLAPGGTLGFTVRVGPDGFEFQRRPADDVDYRIVGTYATIRELARYVVGGDPARAKELSDLARAAIKAGTLTMDGTAAAAAIFEGVHDEVARITA